MVLLIRIIGISFSKWWKRLGYAIISSLLAALNPFFILIILACMWMLVGNLPKVFQNPSFYLSVGGILVAIQGVFPTTLYSMAMQKRVNEGEVLFVKNYLPDYFEGMKKYTVPSLLLTLFYAVISFFIVNSAVFYYHFPIPQSIKIMIITVLVFLYAFFYLTQLILVPLVIYRDKFKFMKDIHIAMSVTLLNLVPVIGIFILDTLIFLVLTTLAGCSLFFYNSISSQFKLNLYNVIIDKYRIKK